MKHILFLAGLSVLTMSSPTIAGELPSFGKTCIGKSGWNTNVCLSSNGTTITSNYNWKGSVATKGTHTGCSVSGSTISCSGGKYSTERGSGKMDPIRVKLSNGKPSSIRWVF